jgi:hypothetical protein
MRRTWTLFFVLLIILTGCASKPDQQKEKVNPVSYDKQDLSIIEKNDELQKGKVLKKLSEDLDGDAHPEDIRLMLLENSQDSQWYDISVKINDIAYNIPKYFTNPIGHDQETNLQTLQAADQSKYIMLSTSFPINGNVTDGDYRTYVFRYSGKKINLVWNGTFPHSQSDFQYIIDTDKFTLELPDYGISYMKRFASDSKYKWIMTERKEREKAGKSIPSIFLSIQEIENLGIRDYDGDGFKEIITQNSILLEDSHIYIGSLYTVYRPESLMNRPDKTFILDRYGISSRLIKEIIDNGSIKKGSWGSTLTDWIETKYNNYTEKDIEKSLSELQKQNIIVFEKDAYRLLLK